MTDYFTRLAERALGTAPLVQPLIAPVFSPDPGVEGSFVEATASPAEMDQVEPAPRGENALGPVTVAEPEPAQPAKPGSSPQRTDLPEGRQVASQGNLLPEVQPLALSQESLPPEAVAETEAATGALSQATAAPASPVRSERQVILVPIPSRGEPDKVSPNTMPAPGSPARAESPVETEAEFAPSQAEPQEPERPGSQPTARPVSAPIRRQTPVTTLEAQAQAETEAGARVGAVRTNLTAAASIPSIEAEEPEEPTIRVTIGRIDVRLVPAAAPTIPSPRRNERSSSPALSLDEYLKQRSEGKR